MHDPLGMLIIMTAVVGSLMLLYVLRYGEY